MFRSKPRIVMLVDRHGWAFDHYARQIAKTLRHRFKFSLKYVQDQPLLDPRDSDLLFVYFWGEDYYKRFGFQRDRIIKLVSSHRWVDNPRYGPCTPQEFCEKYLDDCDNVACVSLRLFNAVRECHPSVYHVKNGFSPSRFYLSRKKSGSMIVGWAGKPDDEVKGFSDILEPACRNRFQLVSATGGLSHKKMNRFYNSTDVFAVSSRNEGEPLTLIEAMAAGCFPVSTDVGIVPELVRHKENGYIVSGRTKEAFVEALHWCEKNLDLVRARGEQNSIEMIRNRTWDVCAPTFARLFQEAHDRAFDVK